jgi:hypothetical protein
MLTNEPGTVFVTSRTGNREELWSSETDGGFISSFVTQSLYREIKHGRVSCREA